MLAETGTNQLTGLRCASEIVLLIYGVLLNFVSVNDIALNLPLYVFKSTSIPLARDVPKPLSPLRSVVRLRSVPRMTYISISKLAQYM